MRTSTFSETLLRYQKGPEKVRDIVRLEFWFYQISLVFLDLLLTFLAFRAAYFLRFEAGILFFSESIIPKVPFYVQVMLVSIPLWLVIFAVMGLYSTHNLLGGTREYAILFNATTLGMFLIICIGFLFPEELILARGWVILSWGFAFLFTAIGRFTYRRIIYAMRRHGHFQYPALIIGGNEEGRLLAEQFQQWPTSGMRVLGYVDDHCSDEMDQHLKHLGTLRDLDLLIEKYGIMDIILTGSALPQGDIIALFRKYGTHRSLNLRMSSGLYEIITTGMQVKEDGLVPLLTINKVRMTGTDRILKLAIDYIIAIPLLLLLLPVFAIIVLLIKLDSAGPIIYRRRVLGVNGREFDAYKFRTMRNDGDALLESNPVLMKEYLENFKIKDDPRVTRLGRFLRKTSLDELPQLFNVLRNEMSLVGPRMICPQELPKYNQWDINLLTVKPGITGFWQVHGRSDVSYEERVRMDMLYIRNWTIWMDIQLLIQTIPAVLSRKGAY